MGEYHYICEACGYAFAKPREFTQPCPYCGQRKLKRRKFNEASRLIKESERMRFSD